MTSVQQDTEWKSTFGVPSVKEDQGSTCVSKAEDVVPVWKIDVAAAWKIGNTFRKRGMYDIAIQFYNMGIEMKCNDDLKANLYTDRATAHFRIGNYKEALHDSIESKLLKPDHLEAFQIGVMCCDKLQDWRYCFSLCEEGLIIDPYDTTLVYLRREAKEKIVPELIAEIDTYISSVRSKEKRLKIKVLTFIRDVEIFKRSIGYEERSVEETESKSTFGIPSVKEWLPRVSKAEGVAAAFKMWGSTLFVSQVYDKVIDYYCIRLKKCEDICAKLYANRALAHFQIDNYEQALRDSTKSKSLKPDHLEAFKIGAMCCDELQDWPYCISLCDEGLVIAPDDKTLLALRKDAKEKIVASSERS